MKTEREFQMDDENTKIPRAPLTRHDYGLMGLSAFGIGCLVMILVSLLLGGCVPTGAEAALMYDNDGGVVLHENVGYDSDVRVLHIQNGRPYPITVTLWCSGWSSPSSGHYVRAGSYSRQYETNVSPRLRGYNEACEMLSWRRSSP